MSKVNTNSNAVAESFGFDSELSIPAGIDPQILRNIELERRMFLQPTSFRILNSLSYFEELENEPDCDLTAIFSDCGVDEVELDQEC